MRDPGKRPGFQIKLGMTKYMLSKLFPLLDYLYIFQLLEYEKGDFINWFLKHPLKRNLQKKNTLDFTPKIQLLAIISSFLMLSLATILTLIFFSGNIWALLIIYILCESISPLFIILSSFFIAPLDFYSKTKIIKQAKTKLQTLTNLKTVAIIGSYAKTSTKNMLYTLLWKDFYVVKTPKSFNTPIAIAQTIISYLKPTTEIFIVEMDAYHPGDIKTLCKIAKPNMAIITAIAPQHLERFGNIEKLAETQFEVTEILPENGLLFLNSSDELTMQTEEKFKSNKQSLPIGKTFFSGELDKFRVENIKQTPSGLTFKLILEKETINVELPLKGEHNAYNFLAAATIAYKLGLPSKTIGERAKLILPTEHRLEITKQGNFTLIDNSYNTNPKVVISSLKLLKQTAGENQKILITPGLIEQGSNTEMENKKFIKLAAKIADEVIIVGESYKQFLKQGLEEVNFPKDKTHYTKSTHSALETAHSLAKEKAVVLIENDLPDQYF